MANNPEITENGHTEACNKRQAEYQERLAKYEQEHPHYCRNCQGMGGFLSQYDPSPPGVSLSPGYMTDFDPCDDCVNNGKCPVCGQQTVNEDGDHCSECGWDCGENELYAAPQQPECDCWYYESIAPAEDALEQILGSPDYLELEADLPSEDREADAFEAYVDEQYGNDPRTISPGWFTADEVDETEAYDDP